MVFNCIFKSHCGLLTGWFPRQSVLSRLYLCLSRLALAFSAHPALQFLCHNGFNLISACLYGAGNSIRHLFFKSQLLFAGSPLLPTVWLWRCRSSRGIPHLASVGIFIICNGLCPANLSSLSPRILKSCQKPARLLYIHNTTKRATGQRWSAFHICFVV